MWLYAPCDNQPHIVHSPLPCSGTGILGMDVQEFRGPTIQRVYQYLRRHAANQNLDTFSYHHGCVEGSDRDFLRIVLRYYIVGKFCKHYIWRISRRKIFSDLKFGHGLLAGLALRLGL